MSTYKLSSGVAEKFDFYMTDPKDGIELHYFVRYPSAADFEPSKDIDIEIEDLKAKIDAEGTTLSQKKEYQNKIDELEKDKAKVFYNLVTPDGHDVQISDLLNRVNVIVVKNFNNMIQKELGA